MSVVVTGVAGFIGSHLAGQLLQQGQDVLGLDCMTDYYDIALKRRNLATVQTHPRFRFESTDLAVDDIERHVAGAACVYHLAAQPGVRGSWGDGFATYVRQNVIATQRLLEALRGSETRIVYASSSSIYGDAHSYPTTEDTAAHPSSPYGVTKLAAEQLVLAYQRSFGLDGRCVRYFTVYGPRQRPDMAFSRFIAAAERREPVGVYGDGLQIRDFTFVTDAVDATIRAGTITAPSERVFNVGGGSEATVLDVLDIISAAIGRPVLVSNQPEQPGDVRRTGADLTLARTVLGWRPAVTLSDGLRSQIAAAGAAR